MPRSTQLGYPGERHPCSSAFVQSTIRGWKWETDVPFMSKKRQNQQNRPPPPLNSPAKSCSAPADSSSVQSLRLIVKINCEARWLFTHPDAWVGAASLRDAHPGRSPVPCKQSQPWAPHVPVPGVRVSPGGVRVPRSIRARLGADQMHTFI